MCSIKRIVPLVFIGALMTVAVFVSPFLFSDGKAEADTYKYRVRTTDNLNVRAKASAKSKKYGVLKKGKVVNASQLKNGNWYKITYKKKTAYISKVYTKKIHTIVTYSKSKKGTVTEDLNVRASYTANSKRLGVLAGNKTVKLTGHYAPAKGTKWYSIKYKGKKAYISGKYVEIKKAASQVKAEPVEVKETTAVKSEPAEPEPAYNGDDFEEYMTKQGFPASYKPYLRKLHKAHPKWVFVAKKTGYSWEDLNKKARKLGVNLIDSSVSKKWRSKSSAVYNSKTGKWFKAFDGGRWYQAKDSVIAYYLDPRNFLNKDSIFQFMGHEYNSKYQNGTTIKSIVSKNPACFMNNATYIGYLKKAGAAAKVNPNVLAAMIVEEQGWYGNSGLISGKTAGYRGYYNFFNIGAYSANGMTATQRGLWYAKGAGTGATSFGRPWDTKYKAIKGGAMFYHMYYVSKNQYNYYSKKFNVFNGEAAVGTHEYMTNVMGAEEEGRIVKYAYEKSADYGIHFYIPVYSSMPAKACPKPAT